MKVADWTQQITESGHKLDKNLDLFRKNLDDLYKGNVRVKELEIHIRAIITQGAGILITVAEICSNILDESGISSFKNTNVSTRTRDSNLHNLMYIIALFEDSASLLYNLSLKWKTPIDSPYAEVGKIHARILQSDRS